MSLSLRDECRVLLRPDCVALARMRRELTPRGLRRHVQAMRVVSCDPPADEKLPWSGALKALEAALPDSAGKKSNATVIISNHFMRYTMVPWSDDLNDETEEIAYAQHMFNGIYGSEAREWELRISPGKTGMPQLASAVDAGLAGALREMFGRWDIGLRSIQPHLMMACNACHASLRGQSGWLAIVEQGSLCLAWLQKGQWSWIRTMRVGSNWHRELPFLLSREELVAHIEDSTNDVFLWAPDYQENPVISGGRWQIRHMQPARMPSVDEALDRRFAKYLSE